MRHGTRSCWPTALAGVQLSATLLGVYALPEAELQDSVSSEPRQLNPALCDPRRITVLRPPTYQRFAQCVTEKLNTTDHVANMVGAADALTAQCWCQENMKQLVEDYHCCEHPQFKKYCAMDCAAEQDCDSDEVTACFDVCPPICLEDDYAPLSCNCTQCYKHLRCIATAGRNSPHNPVCHDNNFLASKQVSDYHACVREHPMRTVWHRHNTMEHCQCNADLKSSLDEHSCCKASWAKPICAANCMANVDCASTEATDCATACAHDHCVNIRETDLSQACASNCFQGDCAKYKACPPVKQVKFDYICEDGLPPLPNGCCKNQDCPALCTDRHFYLMEVAHGEYRNECQCHGCPANVSHQNSLVKEIVMENVQEIGERTISDICRMVGLDYPTQRMLEMMKTRNDKIEELVEGHTENFDKNLDTKVNEIADDSNRMILLEARKATACKRDSKARDDCALVLGTTPKEVGAGTKDKDGGVFGKDKDDQSNVLADDDLRLEDKGKGKGSGGNTKQDSDADDGKDELPLVPIIIGCTAAVLLGIVTATFVCVLKNRNQKKAGNAGGNTAPTTETSDVVVGRPVGDAEEAVPSGGVPVPPPAEPEDDAKNRA